MIEGKMPRLYWAMMEAGALVLGEWNNRLWLWFGGNLYARLYLDRPFRYPNKTEYVDVAYLYVEKEYEYYVERDPSEWFWYDLEERRREKRVDVEIMCHSILRSDVGKVDVTYTYFDTEKLVKRARFDIADPFRRTTKEEYHESSTN